jgi:hypothetical protein
MDVKFYVSLEAARLLKEKGYNEECTTLYDCVFKEIIHATSVGLYRNKCIRNDYYCSAPTKSEAIDWLESKGLIVYVNYYTSRGKWSANINRKGSWAYMAIGEYYLTRLEAEEAAIIKALEILNTRPTF